MIYRQDKKQNIKKRFLVWSIIFILVYVVLFTQVFNAISNSIFSFAVPVWSAQSTVSNIWDNISTEFKTKKDLNDKNKSLKEEINIASYKLLDRNLLYNENIKLKKLLGRNTVAGVSVFATVLTKPNRTPYDTIIIDVGKNKGINKGDKVLYGDNVIIGKIAEVFNNSSKVVLLSSYGEKIDILVGGGNISAVAYGKGGGNFEFKLPRGARVSVGDVISVPSMDIRVLGVVEYIEFNPSNPFENIIFKGPVDMFKLKWVKVMKSSI